MPTPCLKIAEKTQKLADFCDFVSVYQKMIHIANYENFLNIIVIIFLCTSTKLFQ